MPREPLKIWLPLADGRAARVSIDVVEEALGGLDQDTQREPSVSEMEQIGSAITLRQWSFHKPF